MKAYTQKLVYPRTLLVVVVLVLAGMLLAWNAKDIFANPEPVNVIIDTDMGVDDAAAVAWLLSQTKFPVDVVGITTVSGNTTTENAANNVLTILDATGRTDIPVVIGAAEPLSQTLTSTGAFFHGPDGFWFLGWSNPHDLSTLPTDAPDFLCNNAASDVKLVTLGPLTNLARAIAACPAQIALYQEIIVLGGAKRVGNITGIAEFNIWVDPEAADQVFHSGLMPRFIPEDTFDTFTISQENIDELAADGIPVGQLLAVALQPYADLQLGLGGASAASLPDVTAVMTAVDPNNQLFVREEQTALVKMVTGFTGEPNPERYVRGQTIMGLTLAEKIPLIADDYELSSLADRAFTEPGFDLAYELGLILSREPDNASIITDIREQTMRRFFMQYLTN